MLTQKRVKSNYGYNYEVQICVMYATELSINNPKNPVKPILIFTEPSKNKFQIIFQNLKSTTMQRE